VIGSVVRADSEATIQELSIGVTSTGDCTASLLVFSATDPESTWTLEDSTSGLAVPSRGVVSTDELGVLTEPGLYYALAVSITCASGSADLAIVDAPTTDMGFGTAVGIVGDVGADSDLDTAYYYATVESLWLANVGIVEL
jgi:hypothetical protein